MPSRWTTSGIDWANIGQDDRFWPIVDELYLAYKEKRAIVEFYRSTTASNVTAWDVALSPARLVNRVDEIIQGIKYMLADGNQTSPVTGTDRYCYIDTTQDISLLTADNDFKLRGLQMYTLGAGEGLELLIGDLSNIRDWSPSSSRIDSALLTNIYQILLALDTVGNEYVTVTGFGPKRYFKASSSAVIWFAQDPDHATAVSDYNSATPSNGNLNNSLLEIVYDGIDYEIDHWNAYHTYGDTPKDSSDNIVLSFNFDIYHYNEYPDTYIPLSGFDYFKFTKQAGSSDTPFGVEAHPFSPWPTPAINERHIKRTLPIHAIKLDSQLVQYYTP